MAKRRPSIKTALKQRIPPDSRVLVAVSGGRDSMVLLHALLQVQRLLRLQLEVCHVNHRLRSSSDADAFFVREWCQERGLQCHVVSLEERPQSENLEAWARGRRYAAFRELMSRSSLDLLCTAHTANDVAETLLIKLLANKELTSIEEIDPRRACVRPLIDISRDQIDEYVAQFGVPYVEDPTNQDVSFIRNRVRHEVLPLFAARFDPSIVWILAERARSLAADSAALTGLAAEVLDSIGALQENEPEWLASAQKALRDVHMAIRWRVVQLLFTPHFGYTLGEGKARAILEILESGNGTVQVSDTMMLFVGAFGVRLGSH
jgi:tRNA(Ile)-lysidine synthase